MAKVSFLALSKIGLCLCIRKNRFYERCITYGFSGKDESSLAHRVTYSNETVVG